MKVSATVSLSLLCCTSVGAFAPAQRLHAFQQQPLVSLRPSPSTSLDASRRSTELGVSFTAPEKTESAISTKSEASSNDGGKVEETLGASDMSSAEYQQGFAIIAFITLLNASLAPVWHTVFDGNGPPPLFLNAIVSVTALIGLLVGAPLLDSNLDSMSNLAENSEDKWSAQSFRGGMELGVWKGLGKCLFRY